jgi:uncharacterized membrane protein YdbT with pleckstrin-like domain
MAPVKNLARGEYVIFHAHAHWKVLVAPVVVLLACAAGVYVWFTLAPGSIRRTWTDWAVVIVASLVVIIWTIAPFIRWASRTDTLTNYRLISRDGVFTRRGRDIPMDRVHAVTYERTLLERLLGAGTLTVQTAADASDVVLEDVAHVEKRQLQIQEQLLNVDFPDVRPDSGPDPHAQPRPDSPSASD